jgi:UDP-N-acetylglucosamine 1-carboxyvinyltransferase
VDKLTIRGGVPLAGEVRVSGAKNAALPILCAALLTDEPLALSNVPRLRDVATMLALLERMGVAAASTTTASRWPRGARQPSARPPTTWSRPCAPRSCAGPLLARFGEARVSLPGGCAIGSRPVDQHIKGPAGDGRAHRDRARLHRRPQPGRLQGASIVTDMVTVTGTENLLMAAALAEGRTVLENAAREPEVVDLGHGAGGHGRPHRRAPAPTGSWCTASTRCTAPATA